MWPPPWVEPARNMTRASSSLLWFLKIEDIFIIRENVCASVLENLYLEGVLGLLGVHSLLVGSPVGVVPYGVGVVKVRLHLLF